MVVVVSRERLDNYSLFVAGKKGSLTSHESSECVSTVSRPVPLPPTSLQVTAPTPSDNSGHFLTVISKNNNFNIFIVVALGSTQAILGDFQFLVVSL